MNIIRGTTLLRIGMSLVFFWFSSQQFLHPEMWVGFIPDWILKISPIGSITLLHINASLELVFGIALLLGLFTRVSALILALHLADITYTVGYESIGVRDFGLTIATFAIFLNGADNFTLDQFIFFKKQKGGTGQPPSPQTYYTKLNALSTAATKLFSNRM